MSSVGLNHRHFVRNLAIPPPGFAPTDLSGLNAWHDASNAGSITASGGAVSQWNDLSGNGNHLTQATGANQPTTGTRTQNGRNVLDFDGVNNRMTSAASASDTNATLFVVYLRDAGSSAMFGSDSAGGREFRVTSSKLGLVQENIHNYGEASTVQSTATAYIGAVDHVSGGAGTNIHFFLNGAADGTLSDATPLTSGKTLVVGYNPAFGGELHDGWMAELLAYSVILNSTDNASVFSYLNSKWAVY